VIDPDSPASGAAGDFCLPTATGESACLRDFLANGPLLLWFYRGHW
jgi:peroxiredoxin